MNTVSTSFSLRNSSGIQDTVYVLRLLGSAKDYSTEPVNGLSTSSLIVDRPALAQSQLNPLSGSSSIGTIDLQLLDQGGLITAERRARQIRGQEAEVWEGYRGLAWGDFVRVMKGRVRRFDRSSSGIAYTVSVADRWGDTDVERFSPEALSAEPYMNGNRTWDGGTLTLIDTSDPSDSIYDTVVLQGNPVDIMLKLLISGSGSGGLYDVWPAWAGIGLSSEEVDVTWCEAERSKILTVEMEFTINDRENIKNFIETEIARALGGYILLSGSGKLRIYFPTSPNTTSTLQSISDSTIINIPSWTDSHDLYMSHIEYALDHDGEDFGTVLPRRASPQFLSGEQTEERLHKIESRGLQKALGGISIADAVIDALFHRYGNQASRSRLQTFYSTHLIEAGDIIRSTSTKWPDFDGRGIGAERLLEVLQARPSVNLMNLDTIDLTTALSAARIGFIAPNGQPVYASANTAQRVYAYLANDATGQLSNGDGAYVWG